MLLMRLFIVFIVFFTSLSHAQVGIGTTSPDLASLLDISSTTQGVLLPRMTSAQMNAIPDPVKGLTIFNSESNSYYFFNGGSWEELAGAVKRDNYKLVKDIADLADELDAGGGSRYLMNSDFLYEINGAIAFDFPLELNDCYIDGVDVRGDVLRNNTGGALIVGPTGGSLRNVTLDGNGSTIFNITGTGSETVVLNSIPYVNASSLGTVSGINFLYMNTGQFLNCSEGIVLNDIATIFAENLFWTSTCSGTFMTLGGAFDDFQFNNGNVTVDSGETGLDLSANPVINLSASLNGVSFKGDGQFVNPYTSGTYGDYNFTVNWYVNSSGILNESHELANADFYYDGDITTGFNQTINTDAAVEIQGNPAVAVYGSDKLFRFSVGGDGNRLVYDGKITRAFQVVASLAIRVENANNDFYGFTVAKNGVSLERSNAVVRIDNATQIQSVSINSVVDLSNNDYVEIFVHRLTGSGNDTLVVFSENVSIK